MTQANSKASTLEESAFLDIIYQMVHLIKQNHFSQAYELFITHQVTFFKIVTKTQRLKPHELVQFADFVITQKKGQ